MGLGTYNPIANVRTPIFLAGMAIAAVAAGTRLYTVDNRIGTDIGAPMPTVSGVWLLDNSGGAYGMASNGSSNAASLPLTIKPGRAIKIRFRADSWPNAYLARLAIIDPATGVDTGLGLDQLGFRGTSGVGVWTVPHVIGAWVEWTVHCDLGGYFTMRASKWANGADPDVDPAAETINYTATIRNLNLKYPQYGFTLAVLDNSTSIYDYSIWFGTPDPLPLGLSNIVSQTQQGWRYNSLQGYFPISERATAGGVTETFRRVCTLARGGTHVALEFYGFNSKSDEPSTPAQCTAQARIRIGAGAWTNFPLATVNRNDIGFTEVFFPHAAGEVVEIEVVWNGTHLPCMAGGYPGYQDSNGTNAALVWGILSKGFSNDGKKSIVPLTDSRGIFYATQGISELGHGTFNLCIGGMMYDHTSGGTGAWKRQLLRRADAIYLDSGANDIILAAGALTGFELAERLRILLDQDELAGIPILGASMAPCSLTTIAAGTMLLEKTQSRWANSANTSIVRFLECMNTAAVLSGGRYIDLTPATTEPVNLVWRAGMSSDGQHYVEPAGNNAVKVLQKQGITAWVSSLTPTYGLTAPQDARLTAIETRVNKALPDADFDTNNGLASKSWFSTMFTAVGTAISNLLGVVNLVKSTTDKVNSGLEADGPNWRATSAFLAQAPTLNGEALTQIEETHTVVTENLPITSLPPSIPATDLDWTFELLTTRIDKTSLEFVRLSATAKFGEYRYMDATQYPAQIAIGNGDDAEWHNATWDSTGILKIQVGDTSAIGVLIRGLHPVRVKIENAPEATVVQVPIPLHII